MLLKLAAHMPFQIVIASYQSGVSEAVKVPEWYSSGI